MITGVQVIAIYVRDQDRALSFYTEKLGFQKVHDDEFGEGHRWVSVMISGTTGPLIALEKARSEEQVGGFGGGYVFQTDDIETTHREFVARGVKFTEPPTPQMWGIQALFADQDDNIHVLLQPPTEEGNG